MCEFDETLDSRRKQTRKRQMDDHARDRRRLDLLIASLKHGERWCRPGKTRRAMLTGRVGGSTHLVELIHTIRNDASLEDIEAFLLAHPVQVSTLNSPSPIPALGYGDVQRFSSDPVSQPMPMRKAVDLAILFNPPVLTVTAAPWTSISQDSQFISHLVSLWFRWMNPLAFSIDSDHFMADMLAGNPSIYCSPFLMSSILAVASVSPAIQASQMRVPHHSTAPGRRGHFVVCRPRGSYHHGQPVLRGGSTSVHAGAGSAPTDHHPGIVPFEPLVSAAGVLASETAPIAYTGSSAKCMGRAWAGNLLHAMAVRTGKQIGLFATANPQWSPVRSDARSAQTLTAWMLYIRDTYVYLDEPSEREPPN